jgi:DNA-binding MarR family transcriptional regulator
MADDSEALLRAILGVTARASIPPKRLANIVMSKGTNEKQFKAYNLCDGTKTQGEIAKTLKLDAGNFSRTVGRWIEEGVVLKLGEGRESRLLHVYPLTRDAVKQAGDL